MTTTTVIALVILLVIVALLLLWNARLLRRIDILTLQLNIEQRALRSYQREYLELFWRDGQGNGCSMEERPHDNT